MKKYKKHAQLETPLWICRNKWKLEKNKSEKRHRKLEKAYKDARKGMQMEEQWNGETEVGKTDRWSRTAEKTGQWENLEEN